MNIDTLVQRKRTLLFIMTGWFWFEHIFVLLLFIGRTDTAIPLWIALFITNGLIGYLGYFGYKYLNISSSSNNNKDLGLDDNLLKLRNENLCKFRFLFGLEIFFFIFCSLMVFPDIVVDTISIIENDYFVAWWYVPKYIANILTFSSLFVLGYLIYLSYLLYKQIIFQNKDETSLKQQQEQQQQESPVSV